MGRDLNFTCHVHGACDHASTSSIDLLCVALYVKFPCTLRDPLLKSANLVAITITTLKLEKQLFQKECLFKSNLL